MWSDDWWAGLGCAFAHLVPGIDQPLAYRGSVNDGPLRDRRMKCGHII